VGTGVVIGAWVERLVDKVAELGRRDQLTGLPNRRWWVEELPRALAQARRHGHPLSVIMLDLDHFKLYNDEHGHQAGDRLLAGAAAAWTATVREGDAIARYGGEEFTALLPHCALSEAMSLADRLRAVTPRECTCSAGVAEWDGNESADDVVGRADAALYAAKHAGRDRAVAAEPASVVADQGGTRGVVLAGRGARHAPTTGRS
jgi:diguanylate cyclase (GGDEF)-like protein